MDTSGNLKQKIQPLLLLTDGKKSSSHESKDTKQSFEPSLVQVTLGVICIIVLLAYVGNTMNAKKSDPQITMNAAQTNNQGLPLRLKIPSINVNVAIEYVGVTSQGAMGVPTNTTTVGWFDYGPRPGERGSAVIAGHFDGEHGDAGVFAHLSELKEGDKIFVEYRQGISIPFIVRTRRLYDPGYASDVFSRSDGAHLNLITCDGVWEGNKKSYSKRLVIFTDMTND